MEMFITWKSFSFDGDYLLKHSESNHLIPKLHKISKFSLLSLSWFGNENDEMNEMVEWWLVRVSLGRDYGP